MVAGCLTRSQRDLGRLAPTHFEAPTGQRHPIRYDGDEPLLSIRVQELFGLKTHPAIGGGRLPLVLELISPGTPADPDDAGPSRFLDRSRGRMCAPTCGDAIRNIPGRRTRPMPRRRPAQSRAAHEPRQATVDVPIVRIMHRTISDLSHDEPATSPHVAAADASYACGGSPSAASRLRWSIVAFWLRFPLPLAACAGADRAALAWSTAYLTVRYPPAHRLEPVSALALLGARSGAVDGAAVHHRRAFQSVCAAASACRSSSLVGLAAAAAQHRAGLPCRARHHGAGLHAVSAAVVSGRRAGGASRC